MKNFTQTENTKLLRFLAIIPETLQIDVMEDMIQTYHIIKSNVDKNESRSKVYLLALLLSIEEMQKTLQYGKCKKHTRNIDAIKEQSALRIKILEHKSQRSAKKRQKTLNQYAPLVYKLKSIDQKSFPFIAKYLQKHHKFHIDATYLCKLYPDIKEKMNPSLI